nr:aromatic acid exporter family protein [uncultured Caproiciproducens sp.]
MKWLSNLLKTDHRLGFRVVKTGIAVTLCIVVSTILKLDQPFFAVIATVMTMGKSIDASIKMGKNKLIGVLIGAAVGYGFVMVSPANAGLCGVGIIVTLYLCHLFKLYGAATLSSFVFAAMMFQIGTVLTCITDSIIGIVIAILVNLVIMPPNYADEIKKSFTQLCGQIEQSMENAASFWQIDTFAVETAIQKLSYNVNMYIAQAKFLRWNDDEVFRISCKISTYKMILDELKALEVMELTEDSAEPGTEIDIVYHYHMDRMRKLYEHAQQDTEKAE